MTDQRKRIDSKDYYHRFIKWYTGTCIAYDYEMFNFSEMMFFFVFFYMNSPYSIRRRTIRICCNLIEIFICFVTEIKNRSHSFQEKKNALYVKKKKKSLARSHHQKLLVFSFLFFSFLCTRINPVDMYVSASF